MKDGQAQWSDNAIWLVKQIYSFKWNENFTAITIRIYHGITSDHLNCLHLLPLVLYTVLSHTWVQYPGFSGHGVKCPILTTVVPGFSGDLIVCTIRSQWGPFGDLYLVRKNLCVWNKLFLGEIKFSQGELVLWSLCGDKLSLYKNQLMNRKISQLF